MSSRNLSLHIHQDSHPESPREWDNVGTMACWHSRYTLGDEQPDCGPHQHKERLIEDLVDGDFGNDLETYIAFLHDYRGWTLDQCNEHTTEVIEEVFDECFISLPLYLYDHSGITISTGPFSCPWDSGQIGFIYVDRQTAEREYGADPDKFPMTLNTPMGERTFGSFDEFVAYCLKNEVETYDQYLRGEVYGFVLFDEDEKEIDSCWGFYGSNWRTNGITDYVNIDHVKEVCHMEPYSTWSTRVADREILEDVA